MVTRLCSNVVYSCEATSATVPEDAIPVWFVGKARTTEEEARADLANLLQMRELEAVQRHSQRNVSPPVCAMFHGQAQRKSRRTSSQ